MKIIRNGSLPSVRGPSENFTGSVRVDIPFRGEAPARVSGGLVTSEPGARTAWHTHPLAQTLIVTQGIGLVQQWGDQVQEIRQGDVAWIPPGEKHWHGASPTNGVSHIAVAEQLDGKSVEWLEKVSDAQYPAKRRCRRTYKMKEPRMKKRMMRKEIAGCLRRRGGGRCSAVAGTPRCLLFQGSPGNR